MTINHLEKKSQRNERGFTLVIVLAILAIMSILISSNTGALRNLNGHLSLIEAQQLKQYEASRPEPEE